MTLGRRRNAGGSVSPPPPLGQHDYRAVRYKTAATKALIEKKITDRFSVFSPTWACVVVVQSLCSPPWRPVYTASGAANDRFVVAARAPESETVNYSSKHRSHSQPWVRVASKITKTSP